LVPEVASAALKNERATKALLVAGACWGLAAFGMDAPVATFGCVVFGLLHLVCAVHPRAVVVTPAQTARKWFKRQLGMDLDADAALRYAPLFTEGNDSSDLLARALQEESLKDKVFLLRAAANLAATMMNMAPPFVEEARRMHAQRPKRPSNSAPDEAAGRGQDKRESQSSGGRQWQQSPGSSMPPEAELDKANTHVALTALGLGSMPTSLEELKRAWRARLASYHPDQFASADRAVGAMAHEMTLQINRAYQEIARLKGWRA